jgi:hypothetical protein
MHRQSIKVPFSNNTHSLNQLEELLLFCASIEVLLIIAVQYIDRKTQMTKAGL